MLARMDFMLPVRQWFIGDEDLLAATLRGLKERHRLLSGGEDLSIFLMAQHTSDHQELKRWPTDEGC